MKTYLINLQIGDWSNDGHRQSEDFQIRSNLSLVQLEKAYKKGSKALGFDLIQTYCADFEDSNLPDEIAKSLESLGVEFVDRREEEDEEQSVYPDVWAECILAVCKQGNPELEYEFVEADNNWHIGGYGLFW